MALNSYILSCALIVWNTFGFRSLGILGCEGENNHGCDKRHHVVNVLGQSQMGEDGGVRNVCQGTEYRKEYGCSGNVERFPLTEDHNSEGKESGTGYADFEVPGGNGRNDVGKSADTAECTEMITPVYLHWYTLIPTESAACGCSPQARRRSPHFVLKRNT